MLSDIAVLGVKVGGKEDFSRHSCQQSLPLKGKELLHSCRKGWRNYLVYDVGTLGIDVLILLYDHEWIKGLWLLDGPFLQMYSIPMRVAACKY